MTNVPDTPTPTEQCTAHRSLLLMYNTEHPRHYN